MSPTRACAGIANCSSPTPKPKSDYASRRDALSTSRTVSVAHLRPLMRDCIVRKSTFHKGLRVSAVPGRALLLVLLSVGLAPQATATDGIDEYDILMRAYVVPEASPTLVRPEVVVTLEDATVTVLDPVTGFYEIYPAGVGRLDGYGVSRTPVGHFTTGSDPMDPWWYMPRRITPAMYGGLPFLRLTAEKPEGGGPMFGFHGPVEGPFKRGYVSGGCVRLRPADLVRLYYALAIHPTVPVRIQRSAIASVVPFGGVLRP